MRPHPSGLTMTMRLLYRCLIALLGMLYVDAAGAAPAYYTPAATIAALQAFGASSPSIVHAYVQSTGDNYSWSTASTATASTVAPLQVVAASGVSTGRWIREARSYGVIGPGVAPNSGTVVAAPYTDVYPVATGSPNYGPGGGHTSFDFLQAGHRVAIRQDGCVKQIKVYFGAKTGLTGFYVKIWRPDAQNYTFQYPASSTYSFIGQSGNLSSSLTANAVSTLAISPCIPVREGDLYGAHIDYSSASGQPFISVAAAMTTGGKVSATAYYVNDTTPTSPHYDWSAQNHNVSIIVPIEIDMDPPVFVTLTDSVGSGRGVLNTSFIDIFSNDVNLGQTLAHDIAAPFGYTYQNMGIGGQTCATLAGRVATDVVALHPKFAVNNCGINDTFANVPNATILANVTTILSAEIADGEIPIVIGVTPYYPTASSGQMTNVDALNVSLQALVTGAPYNGYYVDPSVVGQYTSVGPLGNLWQLAPACDFGDGIHVSNCLGLLAAQIVSSKSSNSTSAIIVGGASGFGMGVQIPSAPLTVGSAGVNYNSQQFILGTNTAQANSALIPFGHLGQTNDAAPFDLSVLVTGSTTPSARAYTLQTYQDLTGYAGVLNLQTLGGTLNLGAATFTSSVALGSSPSATGTFTFAAGAWTGTLKGGTSTCTAGGGSFTSCANVASTTATVTTNAAFVSKDAVAPCGLFVNFKGAAMAADRNSIFSTGCAGVSNDGNLIIQPSGGTKVGIGIAVGTPAASLEIGRDTLFDSTIVATGLTAASAGAHALCQNPSTKEIVVSSSGTCP